MLGETNFVNAFGVVPCSSPAIVTKSSVMNPVPRITMREVEVLLECNDDYLPEDQVEFLNIEEDFEGRDVLTFKCPNCGKVHRSHRFN